PGLGCCPRMFDHRAGVVESNRIKVFVLPEKFQRCQPDSRADVENHTGLHAELQRFLREVVFQLRWVRERSRFDECGDVVRGFLKGKLCTCGMDDARNRIADHFEAGEATIRFSTSSMSMLCSIMYFALRQVATRL